MLHSEYLERRGELSRAGGYIDGLHGRPRRAHWPSASETTIAEYEAGYMDGHYCRERGHISAKAATGWYDGKAIPSAARYEPETRTIRSVPENYWLATMDSWDSAVDHEASALILAKAYKLHALALQIGRMSTDDEMSEGDGDGMSGDDAAGTLSTLIETCRELTK